MTNSKRVAFVDIAKGLGIMIVCLGHSGAEDFFMPWIGGFIVPLFFFLSGYMYKDKGLPIKTDLLSKAKKLLKPYFFFSFLLLVIYKRFAWNDILGVFYSRYCLYTYYTPDNIFFMKATNSPMWFLTAMLITYPLFYIIIRNEKYRVGIIVSYMLITWGCTYLPILLPWSLDIAFLMAIIMYAGVLFKRHLNWFQQPFYIKIIVFVIFVLLCILNGKPNPSVREYGISFLIYTTTGMLGTISMVWFCKYIENKRHSEFLAEIGRHTLVIFCLQIFIFHLMNRVLYGPLNLPASGFWLYSVSFVKVVAASVVCMYISKLMNRYMPWLFR